MAKQKISEPIFDCRGVMPGRPVFYYRGGGRSDIPGIIQGGQQTTIRPLDDSLDILEQNSAKNRTLAKDIPLSVTCVVCGARITGARVDKKTCGPKCRKAFSRGKRLVAAL